MAMQSFSNDAALHPEEEGAQDRSSRTALSQALWNGAVAPDARLYLPCRTVSDVQRGIGIAAEWNAPICAIGGGHDWAGRGVRRDSVVLDLRGMNSVDRSGDDAVKLGGGTLTKELVTALPPDQAVVTGAISTLGVAGVALGGGYGSLNSRFGLSLDTLLRAEVVLADGSVAVASADDDADLFWAIRGGGGNFGIVTSMVMKTFDLPRMLTAALVVPIDAAAAALVALQDMLDDAGDELSIVSALMTGRNGACGLVLNPLWTGDAAGGPKHVDRLAGMTGARVIAQRWSAYRDTFDEEAERGWPKGHGYAMDARNVSRLDTPVAETLVEAARRFTSRADCIILHDFRGAAARVPSDATAFAWRENHFNVTMVAGWDPSADDDGATAKRWLRRTASDLDRFSERGGYPNLLPPERADVARTFYGEATTRLHALKSRYDPHDRFRYNMGRF